MLAIGVAAFINGHTAAVDKKDQNWIGERPSARPPKY